MGCLGSKDKLTKEDMDFLKSHTRYDEQTIKEWYKGFKVICILTTQKKLHNTPFLMAQKKNKSSSYP